MAAASERGDVPDGPEALADVSAAVQPVASTPRLHTPLSSPQRQRPSMSMNARIDVSRHSFSIRSLTPTPGKLGSIMRKTITHGWFKTFMACAVFSNVVQLGASVEMTGGVWDYIWIVFDYVFTIIFAGEMVIKIIALRSGYFRDRWNCFDCVLAWLGMFDTFVLPYVFRTDAMSQITIIRVFRLLRLMRMVKVLTIQRQLEVVVEGIAASLKSMFWIGLLLCVLIYTCAIFCVVVIGRADYDDYDFDNQEFFGSIWRAMLSLFNMALLTEWAQVIRPIFDNQPACIPIFVVFVIFTTFGILNVIIGVIVERTNEVAVRIRQGDVEKQKLQQMKVVRKLSEVMFELDVNNDQWLSEDEMMNASGNATFHDMLAEIELPKGFSLADLYLMLDQNVDRRLTEHEFVDGMYRLINSNDFQRMCMIQLTMAQLKRQVSQQISQFRHETKKQIDTSFLHISSEIASLRSEILGTSDSPARSRVQGNMSSISSQQAPEAVECGQPDERSQSRTASFLDGVPTPCSSAVRTSQASDLSLPRIPAMPDCIPKAAARSPKKVLRQHVTPVTPITPRRTNPDMLGSSLPSLQATHQAFNSSSDIFDPWTSTPVEGRRGSIQLNPLRGPDSGSYSNPQLRAPDARHGDRMQQIQPGARNYGAAHLQTPS